MNPVSAVAALCPLVVAGLLLAAPGSVAGATSQSRPDASLQQGIRVPRIDTTLVIDGRLDEPVWQQATVLGDFTQVRPREGQAPTERTEVRLLYNRDTFFIGIRAHDRHPEEVLVKELRRGDDQDGSDWVAVVLDTYFDRRNGFYFQINPGGARRDGLVEDQANIRFDWDGIWDGRAVRDEHGWTAEMAIPFKTVSFNPEESRWGLNVQRFIRRKNEIIRWRAAQQDRSIISLQHAGVLTGLHDRDQGYGVDVKPSLTVSHRSGPVADDKGFDTEPALDIFYKPHPSLTAALTLNTDFAQTEVDERRVNLTRFPLFFPEKRAFFLQDAGIFDFGGLRRSPLPFFSRRIGIGPDGEEQDIRAGVKVTGRTQRFNFGLLGIHMAQDPVLGGKNLAVGRVSAKIFEESTIGVIATHGDPVTTGGNHLVGADFNYRNSRDFGDATVSGSAWIERTSSSGASVVGDGSDERAFGGKFNYSSDTWQGNVAVEQIGEHLNPALGFVRRRGVRQYFTGLRHRRRFAGLVQRLDIEGGVQVVTDLDNRLESLQITPLEIELENIAGDQAEIRFEHHREVLSEPFEISAGVIIPTGRFDWQRGQLELSSSRGRALRAIAVFAYGDFFHGHRRDILAGVEWRASEHFFAGAEFQRSDINLPEGEFTTDIARVRADIAFSPDLTWTNLFQYDSISRVLGSSSRLRWIVAPGNELFLVLRHNVRATGGRFERLSTDAAAKASWTFRF